MPPLVCCARPPCIPSSAKLQEHHLLLADGLLRRLSSICRKQRDTLDHRRSEFWANQQSSASSKQSNISPGSTAWSRLAWRHVALRPLQTSGQQNWTNTRTNISFKCLKEANRLWIIYMNKLKEVELKRDLKIDTLIRTFDKIRGFFQTHKKNQKNVLETTFRFCLHWGWKCSQPLIERFHGSFHVPWNGVSSRHLQLSQMARVCESGPFVH